MAKKCNILALFCVLVQFCNHISQGNGCKPASKALQNLLTREEYRSYYCQGSCFVEKYKRLPLGVTPCIEVKKELKKEVQGITITVMEKKSKDKRCG